MLMKTERILSVWAVNQSLGLVLGWFFHSVISHLWTGEHDYILTGQQFFMHNVSLFGCALINLYFMDRAMNHLFGVSLLKYWVFYLLIPTSLFWLGFFLKAVPLDALLWFLSVGLLNGLFIKRQLSLTSNKWIWRSTLSGMLGFIAGAVVLFPLDSYLTSLQGLTAHIVLFTSLGIAAGVPMAVFGGLMLKRSV